MRPSWKGRILALAVTPALVLGASVAVDAAPAASASTTSASQAQAWYQKVVADLEPLQSSLVGGLNAASGWQQGSETRTSAARALARALPPVEHAWAAVKKITALPGQAPAKADYVDAIGLYAEAFRIELVATAVSGPLQTQLQRSFQRVRELGDVTFDQGTAELAPLLGSSIAGADVAAAGHVPDWTALNLAPGPPLLASWLGTATQPSGSEPTASWAAAVASDGAPSQASVRAALSGNVPRRTLTALAGATDRAEVALSATPIPAGHPLSSNRLRLGLLVDVEALLAAEAKDLSRNSPSRSLGSVATTLGSIGAVLRAER